MSTSIDTAFVKQFEREVHEAYQRQGSKLRTTVRTVNNVKGASTTFQKVGKGTAKTKTKNGIVPPMNLDHGVVEVTLVDYYAGDWVDKLDELKINHDERGVIANAGAYGLGRKTDELIINALANTTQIIAAGAAGLTLTKCMEANEIFIDNDLPDDGESYVAVGAKQWGQLLQIDEFANADYVGTDELPFKDGTQAKRWMGRLWMPHSGLPIDGNDIRSCFMWHRTAIGHASGADVKSEITYHGDRVAHFVNNMMSQGAGMIDTLGIVEILCDESP